MSITEQITAPPPPTPGWPGVAGEVVVNDPLETVIRPRRGWVAVDWGEMARSRELLYYLVWRDVKIRYKQTVLGGAWAVLQPLFTMAVFALVFGRVGRMAELSPAGVPYPVFVFAGLIFWTYFAGSVSGAGLSLVSQQHLLTKVYFPRLFLPLATVGALVVDLAISLAIFGALMGWYGVAPGWGVAALVPLVGLMTLAAAGVGSGFAALTVVYRDFRYLVGFAMQIGMYVSPVIYPGELVPRGYRLLLALNPMFGLIGGCRSAVLGTGWDRGSLAISSASAVALFVLGVSYFRRTERRFADLV
jgi:lipopolysaccharide transport system permease protein